MNEQAGTYVEWRVHGEPGGGYPPYEFVWSRRLTPGMQDPEAAARTFVESVRSGPERSGGIRVPWKDGPHLSKRTVVIPNWDACTCPDIDVSSLGEEPGTKVVKGLDPRCVLHGKDT